MDYGNIKNLFRVNMKKQFSQFYSGYPAIFFSDRTAIKLSFN